ncbi:GH116 family glycosyl-hydrolase [Citrobacter amalonaticus]|uniref:GH116 family glycosyl-hydrolase n=1 Tax=Citrobacter amalonaticus TaxID=35703 RepID=UPI001A32B5A4|nr:hypothetical protein [Citrobacter amalonaticus]HDQ2810115.1 hypothetical protein [Citrobacter amalonaticus]
MTLYNNDETKEISFPLGGIGSGSIGLSGNGHLIDWEIFNHPDKGRHNGYSHFAIKAERQGQLLDARLLQGDYLGSASGNVLLRDRLRKKHTGFGCGPDIEMMAGMPHFSDTQFKGEFPFAEMAFRDDRFPGEVKLIAWNPFIPGDEANSSLPLICMEWEITNTTQTSVDYTLSCSLQNLLAESGTSSRYFRQENQHLISLSQSHWQSNDPRYGELAMATDCESVSYQEYWFRGSWFDSLSIFWRDFCKPGTFVNRHYLTEGKTGQDCATLAAHCHIHAGETKRVKFYLSWYMPVTWNYWQKWYDKETLELVQYEDYNGESTWRNYYATQFDSAVHVLNYALNHSERLWEQSRKFHNALHSSTLPPALLEAITANLAVLKSPTCLRLEDGSFYGWEGNLDNIGCCEGSCVHVWNYAQALAFLFPRLSRSQRDLNQHFNLRSSGSLSFRLMLPLGSPASDFRACADGQFGEIINIYRDWLICGDKQWLLGKWPAVENMIAFAWSAENEDLWDPTAQGILTGRQHHTLDMELFGPNPWLTGIYLAALQAGILMARILGYQEQANHWEKIQKNGVSQLDKLFFNGDYYQQKIDLTDKTLLNPYYQEHEKTWNNDSGNIYDFYWNDELQQIKYQLGEGCHIDQLMGQWLAKLCNMPPVFPEPHARQALKAVWKNNFLSMREHTNPCRSFALNDEKGTSICAWPGEKPLIPIPYAEEMMTGFEYQIASLMIASGLVAEGVELVEGIRQRFNGRNRNPWNEFECGSNYARSLASYGLLTAWSGFRFDMSKHEIAFAPVDKIRHEQSYFWSLDSGWGTIRYTPYEITLTVLNGKLEVQRFGYACQRSPVSLWLGNTPVAGWHYDGVMLSLNDTLTLNEVQPLRIVMDIVE